MTGYELSRAVAELKRQGKFAEALELFRREKGALLPEAIARNAWLVADMLTVLRKSGHARAGFAFLRTYGISIDETTDERIVVAFAWLLFDLYKRENETGRFNPSAFYEHLRRIVPLLEASDSIYARSVLSALLRKIVKTEKERASVNWAWLERVTALFDPSRLSTECETITVERLGRMRPMELASDRESWYAVRSKALMETGRMEEALAVSREALSSLGSFHFSNDLWFARRIALAHEALGRREEAITELEAVLAKKREWFILRELAELYRRAGKEEKALEYAMESIAMPGELPYKVGLMVLIGDLLSARSEEMARAHYRLSCRIRREQGWKIPEELAERCRQEEAFSEDEEKKLRKYWRSWRLSRLPRGRIARILHDNERGKDGFLESEGESYYFRLSARDRFAKELGESMEVVFEPMPGKAGRRSARIVEIVAEAEAAA